MPDNESGRLAALRRYKLLDTDPEQSFDDFSRLAAHICQTPTALVSLVDENRQWFKSKFGTDACETSREVSFCAHSVHSRTTLIVEDTHQDPRFATNPLVTSSPHIRFYAGAPLIDSDGFALGSLCVIAPEPRHPTPEQVTALEALARQVTSLCEFRRMSSELHLALEEIKTLQGLLPICMHCKNIRNDTGIWDSIENYVSNHSETSFSHGVCAHCLKLYYREAYDELLATGKIEAV